MVLFSISISIYLLLSSSHQTRCVGDDRLTANTSITLNQTIVSAAGTFALGFFNSNTSTINYYVGIWYNNIPGKEVVWVANRENSLKDSSGVLRINEDGNIALLDAKGSIFWSSNLSYVAKNSSAVLLDSGNLVLRSGDDKDMWQSFDHPADTFLPNMNISRNFKTGIGTGLTSWKTAGDPQPGNFSYGVDPLTPLQLVIWKDSEVHYRSRVWNGQPAITGLWPNRSSAVYVVYVTLNDQGIHFSFSDIAGLELSRRVLDPTGTLKFFSWNKNTKKWVLYVSRPSEPCDVYNRCGAFSICDSSGHSPSCKCLEGFVPKLQQKGNSSEGCARQLPLKCDNSDTFMKSSKMKLPDKSSYSRYTTEAQCKAACLTNCQCTAYAYAYNNKTNDVNYQSRCLIWTGELMDLVMDSMMGEDLYVRIVASELGHAKQSILWVVVPVAVAVVILLLALFMCHSRLRNQTHKGMKEGTQEILEFEMDTDGEGEKGPEFSLFSFATISAATEYFLVGNKLGKGGFGPVYKGKLPDGRDIAVKRLSRSSGQGVQEFKNEIRLVVKLQHTNLVRLLGYCIQGEEKLLIYEYMPNKSLDSYLFDPSRGAQLDWRKRFHIIERIAQGVLYLHKYSRLRIIHRDLKASNILLDSEMNPKISDFGMARIFGQNESRANTNRVVGTYGYMSPEYAIHGLFSVKSDVFSFGVLLMEIVTGKRNSCFQSSSPSPNLLGYAWEQWQKDKWLELIDPLLGDTCTLSEVSRCIQVALLCVQESAADRPTMSDVVSMLQTETSSLPTPKQPAFSFSRPLLEEELPSARKRIYSANGVTISSIEGR